jgi:hypothetical protein
MNNHWEMVPEEWRPSLLTLTDDELKVRATRNVRPSRQYARF